MEYCNQVKFILRSNDHVFIDMVVLKGILESKLDNASQTMAGRYLQRSRICKKNGCCLEKGCASADKPQLQNRTFYIPYLQGSFFILTQDILHDLYNTAISIMYMYFWMEDAYLTGIVCNAMTNVSHVQLIDYYTRFAMIIIKADTEVTFSVI